MDLILIYIFILFVAGMLYLEVYNDKKSKKMLRDKYEADLRNRQDII